MRLISVFSFGGIVNLLLAFGNARGNAVISLVAMIASTVLFFLSIHASRGEGLKVAYDTTAASQRLIANGPYRFIRHPFYASYILFWIGCASYAANLIGYGILLALAASYCFTARGEEDDILRSGLSRDYAAYRQRAGFLWPKF